MNILITVGTTSFDSLVRHVDSLASELDNINLTFQIAGGDYVPRYGIFFEFSKEIESYYKDSDLIITHAGAGTIYRLLELGKKFIIVPNMERVDKHQSDIADYMEQNSHALVLKDFSQLPELIELAKVFNFKTYAKERFFVGKSIADFILSSS
tara:strand:+ start:11582 stop:12040 length:459 start_codon:yes stop_codon:yes gene_type:complete